MLCRAENVAPEIVLVVVRRPSAERGQGSGADTRPLPEEPQGADYPQLVSEKACEMYFGGRRLGHPLAITSVPRPDTGRRACGDIRTRKSWRPASSRWDQWSRRRRGRMAPVVFTARVCQDVHTTWPTLP